MAKQSFKDTVRSHNFFDVAVVERETLVGNVQSVIDLGEYCDRIKITIEGNNICYLLFDGAVPVTVGNGFCVLGNSANEFDIKAQTVRIISTGTPVVHVMGLTHPATT